MGGEDQVTIAHNGTAPTLANVYVNSAGPGFQLRFGELPLLQTRLAGDVNLGGRIDPADLAVVLGNMDAGAGGATGQPL